MLFRNKSLSSNVSQLYYNGFIPFCVYTTYFTLSVKSILNIKFILNIVIIIMFMISLVNPNRTETFYSYNAKEALKRKTSESFFFSLRLTIG